MNYYAASLELDGMTERPTEQQLVKIGRDSRQLFDNYSIKTRRNTIDSSSLASPTVISLSMPLLSSRLTVNIPSDKNEHVKHVFLDRLLLQTDACCNLVYVVQETMYLC